MNDNLTPCNRIRKQCMNGFKCIHEPYHTRCKAKQEPYTRNINIHNSDHLVTNVAVRTVNVTAVIAILVADNGIDAMACRSLQCLVFLGSRKVRAAGMHGIDILVADAADKISTRVHGHLIVPVSVNVK